MASATSLRRVLQASCIKAGAGTHRPSGQPQGSHLRKRPHNAGMGVSAWQASIHVLVLVLVLASARAASALACPSASLGEGGGAMLLA